MKTVLERFNAKFVIDEYSGCWNWQASTNNSGYGTFYNGAGESVGAHRWSYEYYIDKIPVGLTIDHSCKNTLCVNPQHMEVVTQKINTLRGMAPSAINARKTICPRGHDLYDKNLIRNKNGSRACRKCHQDADRKCRGYKDSLIRWTEQEIDILKLNYITRTQEKLLSLLPNRSWASIQRQAFRHKLARK